MTKTEHETREILHAAAKAATEAQVEARAAVAIACLIHDDDLDDRAEREFDNARHDYGDAVDRLADLESRYSGMDAATGHAEAGRLLERIVETLNRARGLRSEAEGKRR